MAVTNKNKIHKGIEKKLSLEKAPRKKYFALNSPAKNHNIFIHKNHNFTCYFACV
jgi:hypothetical protein